MINKALVARLIHTGRKQSRGNSTLMTAHPMRQRLVETSSEGPGLLGRAWPPSKGTVSWECSEEFELGLAVGPHKGRFPHFFVTWG